MYGRDLAHTSFNNTENLLDIKKISTLQPVWTYKAGAVIASAPTLVNGVLYFGDWAGNVNAVDAQTGTLIWKKFVGVAATPKDPTCLSGVGVSSQPVVVGEVVYAGGGDSAVYALDRKTGTQQWRVQLADPAVGSYMWSAIVPYRGFIYTAIASLGDCPIVRGSIARIDPQNPQQPVIRYLVPAGEQGAGVWSTPVIDEATNELFLTTANGYEQNVDKGFWVGAFMKVDPATFATKAYYLFPNSDSLTDQVGGSSPTLFTPPGGVPMAAVSQKNGVMYAIKRSDASVAWTRKLAVACTEPEEGCGSLSTPSFDGKTLYAGAGVRDPEGFEAGSVYAINPADGTVVWEHDIDEAVIAPTTIANGMLFAPALDGLQIYDAATGQIVWTDNHRGSLYGQVIISNGVLYAAYVSGELTAWRIPAASASALYSYSSASGVPAFAPGAIAASYATGLTVNSVTVTDSKGQKLKAEILYYTAGQVNYVVPDVAETGRATVTVAAANGVTAAGTIEISDVAPAIFTANSDGKGAAAAYVTLYGPGNATASTLVFQCGTAAGSCVSKPVDIGATGQLAYLNLYGTGLRGRSTMDRVTCTIGGVAATVSYVGAQGGFTGLDQVNVLIPASLKKRGEVDVVLSVDGQLANTVKIAIQ